MGYNPVQTFTQEADELLAAIEQSALSLGEGEGSEETIHQLFRAFHTIKGSGAMCGLDAVAGFTLHGTAHIATEISQGNLTVEARTLSEGDGQPRRRRFRGPGLRAVSGATEEIRHDYRDTAAYDLQIGGSSAGRRGRPGRRLKQLSVISHQLSVISKDSYSVLRTFFTDN